MRTDEITDSIPSHYLSRLNVVYRKQIPALSIPPSDNHTLTQENMGSRPELRENRKSRLIEKIRNIILETVFYSDEQLKINFSDYLSEKLNFQYTYLANLFSKAEGITIENYIIALKIERVKGLLIYDELNLTEIAFKLHYSSLAHLSNQFKKVTGLTPSSFRAIEKSKGGGNEKQFDINILGKSTPGTNNYFH